MKPSSAVWIAVFMLAVLTLCLVSCAVAGSKTASSVPESANTQTETVRSEAGPAAPEPGVGEETQPAETEVPAPPSEPEMESEPPSEADSGPMILEAMPQESITPVSFEGIEPAKNLGKFIDEVILPSRKGNDNSAKDVGMIVSPYYTLTANGTDVPCYAVRTRYGAHSFAMIDVKEDVFPIELSVGVLVDFRGAAILPESYGVEAQVSDHIVTAKVESWGNYTFILNKDKEQSLTVFIRAAEEVAVPEGYEVIRVAPGVHDEKIKFTKTKQVLVFEHGVHEVPYNIVLKSNTEVFLMRGALLVAKMPGDSERYDKLDSEGNPNWKGLFRADGVRNVRISGHGMVEMSNLGMHAREFIEIYESYNVVIDGVTCDNCPDWTIYISQCQDVEISDVMLLGYRQNSDGICVEDGRAVLVRDCFVRTGDDCITVSPRLTRTATASCARGTTASRSSPVTATARFPSRTSHSTTATHGRTRRAGSGSFARRGAI